MSTKMRARQVPGGPHIMAIGHTLHRLNLCQHFISIHNGLSDYCIKFSYKKVLLVGSNPSEKSPTNEPFHKSTKSRQFVDKWFEGEGWTAAYENLVDFARIKNKRLSDKQIKSNLPWIDANINEYIRRYGYKVVACGKIAAKGLTLAKIEHFEMPHPSGLCRFWNDKEAGKAKIKEMKDWILK